jgi:hypothetical protein
VRQDAYSYRKFFKYPIKIYTLGNSQDKQLVFSKGIELRQIIVAALLFLVLFAFRNVVNSVIPSALQLATYVLLPWFVSGWLCKRKLNGKRIDHFFRDYLFYLLRYRHTRYADGKAVYDRQMKKKQQYEPIK